MDPIDSLQDRAYPKANPWANRKEDAMGEHLVSLSVKTGTEAYRRLLGPKALEFLSTREKELLRQFLMGPDDGWVWNLLQDIGRFDELRWERLLAFLYTCSAMNPPAWPWDQIVGKLRPVALSSSPGQNHLVEPAKRLLRELGY